MTPKSFKKKKVRNGILSILIFILVFSTLTAWTYMDKKIRNLPNWTDLARGNVQLYDNKKLINGFSEDEALVSVENIENSSSVSTNSLNLIGPIDIKFDLTNFASKNGSL
ncbi:MAG: hypothetical protein LBU14_01490 [Candidatus Peribacteria bacterium]|nr:hypothetical protein [Candidatus Peribacteria bacterium]